MSSNNLQEIKAESVQQLNDQLLIGVNFLPSLWISFGGCNIEIQVSSATLKEELSRYFSPLACSKIDADISVKAIEKTAPQFTEQFTQRPVEAGKRKIKEDFLDLPDGRIVRKRNTGMVMIFGDATNLAIGPCEDNPNQVINFVNNRFIEWKLNAGAILGHAAAVTFMQQGVAIAGFSGMGKSTLALHLMRKDADFVSNDRLLMNPENGAPTMTGVAKWPRINPGTALNNPSLKGILTPDEVAHFSKLSQAELWEIEHKYDVIVEESFGPGRFNFSAPMQRLILLNWQRDGGTLKAEEVDITKRYELLPAIMKETGPFYLPANNQPQNHSKEDYIQLLSHCRILELSGGADFTLAISKIIEWLA